jgi:putative membrane protein
MNFHRGKIGTWLGGLACVAGLAMVANGKADGTPPSDPQIVGIVVTANQIDIDAGQLALKKAKSQEVRDFAQQMVTDHTALQKSVSDLGAKLNVKPEDSDTSRSLKSQAKGTTAKLESLQGAAFDKAYIDNEVTFHQAVINATSSVLIPNAKNAELKSALESAAPLFQGHLEHARRLQSELGTK